MQGRRWPWWVWALVGLPALAGIIQAVWKLPSLLYGDVSRRVQTPASRRPAAFEPHLLLDWPA